MKKVILICTLSILAVYISDHLNGSRNHTINTQPVSQGTGYKTENSKQKALNEYSKIRAAQIFKKEEALPKVLINTVFINETFEQYQKLNNESTFNPKIEIENMKRIDLLGDILVNSKNENLAKNILNKFLSQLSIKINHDLYDERKLKQLYADRLEIMTKITMYDSYLAESILEQKLEDKNFHFYRVGFENGLYFSGVKKSEIKNKVKEYNQRRS